VRFRRVLPNGQPAREEILRDDGTSAGFRQLYDQDRPMLFDYELVSAKYGIILDADATEEQPSHEGELFRQREEDAPY
jgi:hypothetical protein